MHELKSQDEYYYSRQVLAKSKIAIFLGLYYHKSNIIQLELDDVNSSSMYHPYFSGSCFGFTDSEIEALEKTEYAHNITFGNPKFNSVDFLRNSDQFNSNIR